MTKVIIAIAFFVTSLVSAQTQFEQGMGKAFGLWKEGKNTEASDMFERIASAEKSSWLPNYYVALVNTTEAFKPENKEKVSVFLDKANAALDIELAKNKNNAELLVIQAMAKTALLASNPMAYGMTLSPKIAQIYALASLLAPENPRVVYCKAEFAIGGAKWTGADVKQLWGEVEKAIGLFATFKPETVFSPKWGLERATAAIKNCK
ncbi:hypothetical protein [Flavobacterium psychrophilum]|uniref:hypothetical protein n=1 Tax=Flavobacterium psychrophilum TaxID=96345 RepID=UPI000A38F05D|nr:hypothetical protein [Flavobacterium psychrophilum]OUD27146.1 hypothetical protein FPG92_09635 [Flavobacterium psychrophilum]